MNNPFHQEFEQLDKKMSGYFGDAKDTSALFEAMTDKFFKGQGGMDTWDQVDQSAQESGVMRGITQAEIEKNLDECVESFFESTIATLPTLEAMKEQADQLQLADDEIRFNLFLRQPAAESLRKEASKILAIVTHGNADDIEQNLDKPIIKVLINETLEKVQTVQQMFNQATLVSTIKPCMK